MKKYVVLSVLFAMFFAAMGFAQDAAPAAKKDFVIGVEQIEYQPYYGVDPKAPENYIGYAREFFDAFAKEKGYTITYKMLPVKRLFAEFFDGTLDFKFPDNPAWSGDDRKDKTIAYSTSVCDFTDGLMVHVDNKDMTADKLVEIGTVRGFTAWSYLGLVDSQKLKISEANTIDALLQQVEAKRIDGAYGNIIVSQHALKAAGIDESKIVFASQLPHHKDAYLCSTLKHPEIVKEIDAFLTEKADLVKELRAKYGIKMHNE